MRQGHHIWATLQVDLIAASSEVICCVVHRHRVPSFKALADDVNPVTIVIREHRGFWVILVAQNASEEVVFQLRNKVLVSG